MSTCRNRWSGGLVLAALSAVLVASPASAAGFIIFEQGSKAMGMAAAFTAQADDPSAMFHNVAGLAFQRERDFSVGVTLVSLGDSQFEGANPFPGESARAEQADNLVTPPHAYYVHPFGEKWTFGLGVLSPFGLVTEWDKPETFPGRNLSTRAELVAIDINPSLAWQVTPNFGIGFGAVVRSSTVELDRIVTRNNPFAQAQSNVADVNLKSDLEQGYGWNIGILHKYNNSFSWGFSYRSKLDIDYSGEAKFKQILTGNAQFDAAVARALPFGVDQAIETSIDFPDMASLGIAVALSPNTMLELDTNWTGWSSFQEVAIDFPENAALQQPPAEQLWDDAMNYRLGFRFNSSPTRQWRAGYWYDETPQPANTMGPLLPDANRNGLSLGYGLTTGKGHRYDLALMYVIFDDRSSEENLDNFNGSYEGSALLLGVTATF